METERGQTALDFAVAIGVFVLAMAFVLAFVPSMFAPFFGMGAADGLVADRSASYLADNKLAADPAQPGALDQEKVDTFFDNCATNSSSWLAGELGVGTDNIHIQLAEDSCGNDPDGAETVSKRIVTVDGDQRTLEVTVW